MQVGMVDRQAIRRRWEAVGSKLDERGRRMFAAGEALVAGWGGLEAVSEITGLARSTIGRGKKELDAAPLLKGRVRRDGAGRPDLSSRGRSAIRCARCCGCRKATKSSRTRCRRRGMRSAPVA